MRVIFFIFCGFALIMCSQQDKNSRAVATVSIDPKRSNHQNNLSQEIIVDSLVITNLALPDSVYMGAISDVKIYDDYIFILDTYQTKSLLCFYKEAFLFQLKRVGTGPGEYEQPISFFFDKLSNEVVIYDRAQQKLNYYDLKTLRFVRENWIKKYLLNIDVLGDNHIVLVEDYLKNNEGYLQVWDRALESRIFSHHANPKWISETVFPFAFSHSMDTTFMLEPFTETLYSISNNGIKPRLEIKYSEYNFPLEDFMNQQVQEVESQLYLNVFAFSAHLPMMSGNNFSFIYYLTPKQQRLVSLNLKTNEYRQYKIVEGVQDGHLPWPKVSNNGFYYAFLHAPELFASKNEYWINLARKFIGEGEFDNSIVLIKYSPTPA